MAARLLLLPILAWLALASHLPAQVVVAPGAGKIGQVRGGPPKTLRVPLRNAGAVPIEIVEALSGCSCLSARLDRKLIAPGDDGIMEVHLRTLGHKNGPYLWSLKLRSRKVGTQDIEETPLRIEAVIRNEVTLEPSELSILCTGELTKEIVLTDLREKPFRITRLDSTVKGVMLDAIEQRPGVFRILMTVRGTVEGMQDGRVVIRTSDPEYPEISLPLKVTWAVVGKVQAIPPTLRLGAARRSALVRLRTEGAPLKVERVEAPGLKCSWAEHASGEVFLKVAIEGAPRDVAREVRICLEGRTDQVHIPIEWE